MAFQEDYNSKQYEPDFFELIRDRYINVIQDNVYLDDVS